jgi:hypothetical protein
MHATVQSAAADDWLSAGRRTYIPQPKADPIRSLDYLQRLVCPRIGAECAPAPRLYKVNKLHNGGYTRLRADSPPHQGGNKNRALIRGNFNRSESRV